MNPETITMRRRPAITCDEGAVRAELHATYSRKAWRVGLTLNEYCNRFGIKKVWEVRNAATGTVGISI